jgi:hypothetical protein
MNDIGDRLIQSEILGVKKVARGWEIKLKSDSWKGPKTYSVNRKDVQKLIEDYHGNSEKDLIHKKIGVCYSDSKIIDAYALFERIF